MAACTGFINILTVLVNPRKPKLLITMLKRDKKTVKRYLIALFAILLLFPAMSCKTCKCPAYSKIEPSKSQSSFVLVTAEAEQSNSI